MRPTRSATRSACRPAAGSRASTAIASARTPAIVAAGAPSAAPTGAGPSMAGRKRQTRLRPLRLAKYMAWSAAPKRRSGSGASERSATPTETVTPGSPDSLIPATAARARSATARAVVASDSGRISANSSPPTRQRVLGPHLAADRGRHGLQDAVADGVSVGVVDELEVVQVAYHEGEGPPVPGLRGPPPPRSGRGTRPG